MTVAERNRALMLYAAAILVLVPGVAVAVGHFPGGFDWAYTVISKLASRKHNPEGGPWLSGALLAAVILLWPVAGRLGRTSAAHAGARVSIAALRAGLIGGALLAAEGLFSLNFSSVARKGHEWLALLTMLGVYCGVLGLYIQRIRHDAPFLWPALLIVMPIFAIGISQLGLYFDQRELGWVNTGWRELGVPIWLSFAFWQWLAVAALWTGLGHLVATLAPRETLPRPTVPAGPPGRAGRALEPCTAFSERSRAMFRNGSPRPPRCTSC